MGQPGQQQGSLVLGQTRYEVGSLGEHVEKVQDCQDNLQVEGRQEQGQMFHAGIQMSAERMFNEQSCEVECPQNQLLALLGLISRLVTGQNPGPGFSICGSLQDFITEV